LAEVIAALAARLAGPAGEPAVHDYRIARGYRGHAHPHRRDLAGRLDPHHQGQLALGERHAAVAPQVKVIEANRLDADLYLTRAGRGRLGHVGKHDLAVGNEGESTHVGNVLRHEEGMSQAPAWRGGPVVCPTIRRYANRISALPERRRLAAVARRT